MAQHTHTDNFYNFHDMLRGSASTAIIPNYTEHKRGDVIHISDGITSDSVSRTIAKIDPYPPLRGYSLLTLIDPSIKILTQYSLTNGDGQTTVLWLGDPMDIPVGQRLILDDGSEWTVDSRWTSLRPKDVPQQGRIGLVKELVA